MKTIKVQLKIINCCSKGNVVSLRNSMKFPEANKYMDTKKPRDSSSLPKNSHLFEILNCLRLQKGLFTPTLYFLELSSHQTVDFPEQGEPQKSLSLWVHAHPFFFRGTEDGPEKLSLERVLFSLKANSVIKVRNRTISKRCCLIYFSLSLKARQATVHMVAQSRTWLKQLCMHAHLESQVTPQCAAERSQGASGILQPSAPWDWLLRGCKLPRASSFPCSLCS